jgi:hypothetical protein
LGGNNEAAIAGNAAIYSPLKPIPASFIAPQTQKANKTFRLQHRLAPQQKTLNAAAPNVQRTKFDQAKLDQAKLEQEKLAQANLANTAIFAFIVESSTANPNLVHPANLATNSAVSTQTIFVIVQNPAAASGQPIFQIHFWQVTVFHPATASKHAPNKET